MDIIQMDDLYDCFVNIYIFLAGELNEKFTTAWVFVWVSM